ncbi:MAG: carbohydrate kinase family protein [Gammaproteobacteria bacterium]
MNTINSIDVLCVGHAAYDLIFSVSRHPAEDEKIFADSLISCGGGPAANAAVTVARLGYHSAFAGYLGLDIYGEKHFREFEKEGVNTSLVVRGESPTPVSTIIVKPDGKRALVNFKGDTQILTADAVDCTHLSFKAVLFDGHEPRLSQPLAERSRSMGIPSVLDAGSLHEGTTALMSHVDYLVCSEKFAVQYAGNENDALKRLADYSPHVVITLGERGLIWRCGSEKGTVPAFPIASVDTTGAGDAFHGAFAAAVAAGMTWDDILLYAGAAGSLCCSKIGARPGLPTRTELLEFLKLQKVAIS